MAITLHVDPKTPPLTWEEFASKTGPFAVALDGYVKEGPITGDSAPRINLNHHEGSDRLATRATCAQVLLFIRQGIFEIFNQHGEPTMDIYVNDCDQDVCTSVYLLTHAHIADQILNPRLNRLVFMEDMLDSTAGSYPFPDNLPALMELAWVFQPYTQFRLNGGLDRKDPEEYQSIITDVCLRINEHIMHAGKSIPLDTRYERISGNNRWGMFKEIGAQAFSGIAATGIHAFVSVRERSDGRYNYTLWRSLPVIPFDIPALYDALNAADDSNGDRWGGGNTIGGSPRVRGSKLTPKQVEAIVTEILNKR